MKARSFSPTPAPLTVVDVDGSWIDAHTRINDPEGASFLGAKDQPVRSEAFETAVRVGLRALATADSKYTEQLLDAKLDSIVGQLASSAEDSLTAATSAFQERWQKAISEDLATRLTAHQRSLDEAFTKLFSSDTSTSVQADLRRLLDSYHQRVEKELAEYHATVRREVTASLSGAGDPEHPISKVMTAVEALRKEVAVQLEASRIAASAADIKKRLPREGLNYQDEVHELVARLLASSGDEVELMGRRPGVTGGADGDMVITLDKKLAGGTTTKVAVEVTRETKLTVTRLKQMLAKSRADRAAQTAIVIIGDAAPLGGQRLAVFPALGVVAVFEPDGPDGFAELPVQIAIKQARIMAIQENRQPADERDDRRIEVELTKAREALDIIDGIVGNQQKISKFADGTSSLAKELRRRIIDALDAIDGCLEG